MSHKKIKGKIVWGTDKLPDGGKTCRLHRLIIGRLCPTKYFIDGGKVHYGIPHYSVYGSGMSERGVAKLLGQFRYLKDAKAYAVELYTKEVLCRTP